MNSSLSCLRTLRINHFYLILYALFFVFCFLFFIPPPLFAQTNQATITVIPSLIRIDLAKDQPQASISYTNHTDQTVELHLSVADYAPLEDDYRLEFLQGKDATNYKYSLSSWIHFESNDLLLDPGETKATTVFVDANRLTTGAHYGTIQAAWEKQQPGTTVPLRIILSSLIFVRTHHGNETEQATIPTFQSVQEFFSFPQQFVLRVKNTGNVDITPHGLLTVTDMFDNQVATGLINEDSLLVYPESIRRFALYPQQKQAFLFPGIYHVQLYIHFGKKNTLLKKAITFFSFGSVPFLFVIAIVCIFVACFWYRYIKPTKDRKSFENS